MSKFKLRFRQFNDVSRVKFILVLLVFVIALTFSIPSLARYKNYINLEAMFNETQTWDGSIATSFASGEGTLEDPYIISNASEFAYFATNIDESGYSGLYFKLSDHIILNDGVFNYNEVDITYTLNDTVFYLDEYSNEVYDNKDLDGNVISNVNLFSKINNFRGNLDGDYHTIYGLYLSEDTDELALFNNMSGKVENLYFKNSFVYGGSSTAILANTISFGEVNNVSTDGIVVGKGNLLTKTIAVSLDDFTEDKIQGIDFSHNLDILKPLGYTFESVVLSGEYIYSGDDEELVINNESFVEGEFITNVEGDSSYVTLGMSSNDTSGTVSLTNLKVLYTYNYPITSGFVASSNDSNFRNVINKAKVYGINVSGLFGTVSNLAVSNAYNLGNLSGTNVSGVVNSVVNNDETVIDKVYNNGNLIGSSTNFVGNVSNSGSLRLSNSFNIQEATSTFGNVSGIVNVTRLYDINNSAVISGTLSSDINVVIKDNLTKELLVDTMEYAEYIDDADVLENPNNIWIYEYDGIPILYVDELNNPIASLNLGVYSWNDWGYELNNRKFTETKAFNVTSLNSFIDLKKVYYYLHNSETPLSKSEIATVTDWVEYEDVVSLDMEGYFIVYVKVVDQNDYNYYINSDIMLFDLYGPDINITLIDKSWNKYNDQLDSVYINDDTSLTFEIKDKYSEVLKSEYYISQSFVTKEDLDVLDSWKSLENEIVIDRKGPNIVYIKSEDSNGHINIVNSDYIIYGGYNSSLSIGSHTFKEVEEANINSKSSVLYKFTYEEDIPYVSGHNTKLIMSEKLPVKTLITMVNHNFNEVYSYEITEDDSDGINLDEFTQIGNVNDVHFDDVAYLVVDKKELSFVFDFSNIDLEENFSFGAHLELRDKNDYILLSTLKDDIKVTNVYNDINSQLSIVNKSVIYGINYDSESKNMIDFEYSFDNLVYDNVVINDTYYEDLKSGIAIKLVDSENNIIDKKYLKNMEFIINGVNYFADNDGIVRINMNNGIEKVVGNLTVVTHENDLDLNEGDYSLVIEPFVACDGKYTDNYSGSNISIPVVSDYEEILDFEFNVNMSDELKMLVKDSGNVTIPFDIISNNEFENPSIRISLYKKKTLTAYDQNYQLIDLDDYSSNEFTLATDYSYIVKNKQLELNLDLTNMEKTGYELRFELFDGDRRIDVIKKKFIVR